MRNDIQSVLFSEEQLAGIVQTIGKQISEDYKDKNLLMVSVLKGSVVFMADLMRAITIPCSIDFMSVSSYGSGTKTSGVVKIIKDLDINLKGYDLLVVEDILDSGLTLSYILELLQSRSPKSIKVCTLFDKPDRRTAHIKADYAGTIVPDEFIVGYGLDYDEKYRNLPFVGILKPEVYEEADRKVSSDSSKE
ncbi:hypoxanthine phosphoribosyltransferase [Caproiciproducens faecalis]|uniref:Hypoxanthine phosphoribosyltransferase n=1 Tax=Caproiciproducens faecalis TaxID=2820301 RepID=A0ABS7DPK0_9FIRM|nr:hypoxanthine phosphoribosyltransferase [Caproiciproducens faecalis]MBW7573236.1 hypoxanthine phosphoribosyltransferase [Caproiciproducens faecalis]